MTEENAKFEEAIPLKLLKLFKFSLILQKCKQGRIG